MMNTMPNTKYVVLGAVVLLIAWGGRAVEMAQVDPSRTTYGERNPSAPKESWRRSRSSLASGRAPDEPAFLMALSPSSAECPGSGRYVLDGTAIADELHAAYPDGRPFLGIGLRHYDASRKAVGLSST